MAVAIEPEPPDEEREAIGAALAAGRSEDLAGWAQAAFAEGVEEADIDP